MSFLASASNRWASTSQRVLSRSYSSVENAVASSSKTQTPTDHYRITLRRSAIGLPEKSSLTLASLGLRKRLQSVYLPQRSDIAGMILAVKELVHVENVRRLNDTQAEELLQQEELEASDSADTEMLQAGPQQNPIWVNANNEIVDWGGKVARKAPRGYKIVGNISNELRNEEIQAMRRSGKTGEMA